MSSEQEKKLRVEFTNYERTVWLVNSIEGHLRKYYDNLIRYFDRYPKIPQNGSDVCLTPDFTVVFDGPYEIVGEVKRALGQNERLEENFEQLKAYDGKMLLRVEDGDGYKHSTTNHDLLVFVNIEYARAASKKLYSMVEAERKNGKFQRAVSVFAATNDGQQARPRWVMVWENTTDKLRDAKLPVGSRLSERHQENDEQPIVVYPDSFAGVQSVHWFCNDRPPEIYVAVILWAKIFPRMMTNDQREAWTMDSDCHGIVDIEVTVQSICDATRQFLSHYLVKAVIKSVMEVLRKAKLVTKKSDENYIVHFKRFKLTQFSSDEDEIIEEVKLDHQREALIRAIVRGEKPARSGTTRISRRRKRFTDKRQIELI